MVRLTLSFSPNAVCLGFRAVGGPPILISAKSLKSTTWDRAKLRLKIDPARNLAGRKRMQITPRECFSPDGEQIGDSGPPHTHTTPENDRDSADSDVVAEPETVSGPDVASPSGDAYVRDSRSSKLPDAGAFCEIARNSFASDIMIIGHSFYY